MNQNERWKSLMSSSQKGHSSDYAILLAELAEYGRVILRSRGIKLEILEEIVQETLISVHKYRHTYDQIRPFKPWFHSILNSRLSDCFRKISIHENHEIGEEDLLYVEADQEISGLEVEALQKAMNELSEQQKEIVLLLKFEGLSIAEVAKRMNMSESAIKVAAHRSYKKIYEVFR